MFVSVRGGRGVRGRGAFRRGGRTMSMRRRGGRGGGRGATSSKQKDPCSVYVSFLNPIEAVCAGELLEVAKETGATLKFGRHCYLTFGSDSEASDHLNKAGDVDFGGLKAYVDHAYKSQSAKAAGKREAEVNVQASPTKKMKVKSNTGGPVEKEGEEEEEEVEEVEDDEEKVETMEEDSAEVEEGGKETEMEEEAA